MPTKRELVVAAARACIGTPFVHQGRIPGVGLDCIGVVLYAAREAGLYAGPDFTRYDMRPRGDEMTRLLDQHMDRIEERPMKDGDVLHIAFARDPQHVGIVCGGGMSIIHVYAHPSLKKCVEHPLASSWLTRVRAVYRFKGIDG